MQKLAVTPTSSLLIGLNSSPSEGEKMKTLNRLLTCLGIAILAIATVAQQRTATNVPSVERLRAHIEYLASDKLEGRRTGTPGAKLAAEYIAREFSRYGLRRSIGYDTAGMSILEADSPKRYLQEFPYVSGVELGEHNLFYVNPGKADDIAQFRVGEDWMPLGFSSNGKIHGAEMVFAGYGISSAELKYDDYSASSAKDRVSIVFAGTPDGDNLTGSLLRRRNPFCGCCGPRGRRPCLADHRERREAERRPAVSSFL